MSYSKTVPTLIFLLASLPSGANELSQDPIGDARSAIQLDADFDAARVLLEAYESHALEASPPVSSESLATMNFLMGVMEYYLNQDEEAAKARWGWSLQIQPTYQWDEELVGGAGQDLFEEVRQAMEAASSFAIVDEGTSLARPVFIDGSKIQPGWKVKAGQHLIQARCSDGIVRGVYAFVAEGAALVCPCPLDSCIGEENSTGPTRAKGNASLGKVGVLAVGGGWFSAGEGFSPMTGVGISYRPMDFLQMDFEGGAYLSTPLASRTDGAFGRLALSYIYGLSDGLELSGGVQANLLLAQDLYDMPSGDQIAASYSGLVAGFHAGVGTMVGAGHQVGIRMGYVPVVVEGNFLLYMNTMTDLYFRYSF